MKRFVVTVMRDGAVVRDEEIKTLPELKSFLYGIRESRKGLSAYAYDRMGDVAYALARQESGRPLQKCNNAGDEKFFRQLQKSAYHPEGRMVS